MRKRVAWLLVLFSAWYSDAAAVCMVSSPCERYWASDAVFVGTVTDVKRVVVPSQFPGEAFAPAELVRLSILEPFRGVADGSVAVLNVLHAEAAEFRPGETFFVYASRAEDGVLQTSLCAGTSRLDDAYEDRAYARWIRTPRSNGRVFGSISHGEWDCSRGDYVSYSLPSDLVVSLVGPGGSWRIRPYQADGLPRYLFDGIPPGRYRLQVHAEGPFDLGEGSDVELTAPQLCFELNLQLHWKGLVRGRVIDAEGRPVPSAPVTMFSGRPFEPARIPWQETVITDERGEFTHRHVPAGDYTLGMYTDEMSRWERKYQALYFPGVLEPADAHTVTLARGSELDIGDFRLPIRLTKVPISGSVRLPDGTPVPDVWVSMHGVEDDSFDAGLEVKTDGNGRFRLPGVDGRRYQVSASAQVHETFYSGSVEVTAGTGGAVTLCLTRVGP